MKVRGEGSVYMIDCWNAEIAKIGQYKKENGCTTLDISLSPGEARMYMIDQNEPDSVYVAASDADHVLEEDQEIYACVTKTGEYDFELSDGTKKSVSVNVPDELLLSDWTLEVESWDEGDKKEITENRGLGIVTKEVYYETKKGPHLCGRNTPEALEGYRSCRIGCIRYRLLYITVCPSGKLGFRKRRCAEDPGCE